MELCDNLEEWGEDSKGGDVCILLADSHHCMAKANTISKAIILQLEIN